MSLLKRINNPFPDLTTAMVFYAIAGLLLTGLLIGCSKSVFVDSPEMKAAKAKEHELWLKGPKYHGNQCYKIINKKSSSYGCTFYSEQGEMFLTTRTEQSPGYRDQEREGDAIDNPAEWRIIWNIKIRCLGTGYHDNVREEDVEVIDCPEWLYH